MAVIDEVTRPEDPAGDWMKRAACKGLSHLFFPAPAERPQARERREAAARSVCGIVRRQRAVPAVRPAAPRVRLLGRRERGRAPRRRLPPDRPDRRPRPRRLTQPGAARRDCCENAPVPTSRTRRRAAAEAHRAVVARTRGAHPWVGQPYPLGATYDGSGTNFSLFSSVAEGVELCLLGDADRDGRAVDEERVELHRGRRLLLARLPARRPARASATATGSTARGTRPRACGATRPSCSSTRTPRRSTARSTGTRPASPTTSTIPTQPNTADSAPHVPRGRRRRPVLRLGQRPPAATTRCTRRSSTRPTSGA